MTIFTSNNVPLPANSSTIISETHTVLQTNGSVVHTLVETTVPYVSGVNPTATVVTNTITTVPGTQTYHLLQQSLTPQLLNHLALHLLIL